MTPRSIAILLAAAVLLIPSCGESTSSSSMHTGDGDSDHLVTEEDENLRDKVISWRYPRQSIRATGVTGVAHIFVWDRDSNSMLWVLDCNREKISEITYARVPDGCTQMFPEGEDPREIGPNADIGIQIKYLFDSTWPPAASTDSIYLEVVVRHNSIEIEPAAFLQRPYFDTRPGT